ncbi:hypothetical protein BC941DRAFT_471808 [Chlamydoabsidia padenii]|nr:hypothetical protein BC941DRAFT_471808 [Chlamydoabsidia padenii]
MPVISRLPPSYYDSGHKGLCSLFVSDMWTIRPSLFAVAGRRRHRVLFHTWICSRMGCAATSNGAPFDSWGWIMMCNLYGNFIALTSFWLLLTCFMQYGKERYGIQDYLQHLLWVTMTDHDSHSLQRESNNDWQDTNLWRTSLVQSFGNGGRTTSCVGRANIALVYLATTFYQKGHDSVNIVVAKILLWRLLTNASYLSKTRLQLVNWLL